MQDVIAQLLLMLRGAWRYRWPAMLLTWVIALGGWLAVAAMPDRFAAYTKVRVDTASLLKPLLEGIAVDSDIRSQVQGVQARMVSRGTLEKVAVNADLMVDADNAAERAGVVDWLQERIKVTGTVATGTARRSAVADEFMVSFEDSDPRKAHRVVQAWYDIFVEDAEHTSSGDADVAKRFLDARVAEYEQKVREADDQIAAFKKQHVGAVPGTQGRSFYDRLEQQTTELEALQAKYLQVSERRNELMRQIQGEEPTFGLTASAGSTPIDSQISSYQARIDQLLLQYTEKHPEIVALKDTIARLEEEKAHGAKVSSTMAPPTAASTGEDMLLRSLDMNPVYQKMKIGLSEADTELAELRGQISAQKQGIEQLRSKMDQVPGVEADLARLERDRDASKEQYDDLMKRRERARISEEAGKSSEGVRFETVEPPTVPLSPSGPDRILLSALVLLASLGAGLGFAMLLQQLRPVFSTKDTLRQVTGLPVLGSVTAAILQGFVPWYRRQTALVGGALAALGVAFLLNLLLQQNMRSVLRSLLG